MGSGTATAEIKRLIQVSDRRVREWAQNYQQEGLDGLQSHWQSENALKLSREQRTELRQRLQQYRPDQVIAADIRISRGSSGR
jgi:transposase